MEPREQLEWASAVRGLVLGLGCGDALGRAAERGDGADGLDRVPAGVASQLAAFTIDGSIRAIVRTRHKGIGHPPTVLWHAYCRWAWSQGIDAPAHHADWSKGTEGRWPDGWLAEVSLLGRRRGDAPATLEALAQRRGGTPTDHVTHSAGAHAVIRTLPVAALSRAGLGDLPRLARESAALTHGDPVAQSATALAVRILVEALTSHTVVDAVEVALAKVPGDVADVGEAMALERAEEAARTDPRTVARLTALAPDATSRAALLGGVYVALSFPDATDIAAAMAFATLAPDPPSVAAMAGALLGAVHGVGALPADLVARLELGWVLDTLARDLVHQVVDDPSGGPYTEATDPGWWSRYPGW